MARHHQEMSLWLPFLLFISLLVSTHQQKCETVADVGFILDSSFSLRNEYSDEKQFVKELARYLTITDYGNRASVITFSSQSELSITFNQHFMTEAFNRAVDDIPLMGQQTRIDKALRMAQRHMFTPLNGARTFVPHILILLTDGSQTYRSGAENPAIAAQELRDSGVILFVIGIGNKLDKNEMINIAGDEKNVFVAKDFKELITKEFVAKVSGKTCSVAKVKSMWSEWTKWSPCSVSCGLGGQRTRTRTCSSSESPCLLSDGSGRHGTFELETKECTFISCKVNGNWGEWSPYGDCSANCGGGRQKRRRLCNNPSAANGGLECMLTDKSGRAKEEGETRTCNTESCSGETANHCSLHKTDIGFLLDSSGSMRGKQYKQEKHFLKRLASSFKQHNSNVRTSVITYSAYTNLSIKFNEHVDDTVSFNKAVDEIPFMNLTTRIDKALKQAKNEMFSTANGARKGAHKIIILLTDGTQTGKGVLFPVNTANELRDQGVVIFVVGIGGLIDIKEIKELAGKYGKYFIASTFDGLVTYNFVKAVAQQACPGKSFAYCKSFEYSGVPSTNE